MGGDLAEPVSCPEGRSLQKAGCGLQSLKGGGEGKAPGFGRGGPGRPWSLSSLGSTLAWLRPHIAHRGPAPLPLGLQPASPPTPASGLRALLCQEGRLSKAIFGETSLPMRHWCSDWKEQRGLRMRQEDTATKESLATTGFEKTPAPHSHELRWGARPPCHRPLSHGSAGRRGAEPTRASCVSGWFCVFSADSVQLP